MNKTTRITPVTPPAGFLKAVYLDCADEYGEIPAECQPYGSCACDREISYHGPNVSGETFGGVTSQWTPEKGIFFILQKNDGELWTRDQLAELPALIDSIEQKIDQEIAVDLMKSRPEMLRATTTVNKLCDFAVDNGVTASAAFAAYQELTKGGHHA
ncbi:hypothetical protein M2368_001409 [Arthrobacter sp. JUb119]|nr:hypothetical protein [Arthrobacter sp. JUb119]